ncbi:site-specific integrase [Serratia ureilytica]|uniref:site-specific integrase n=1 Tax=Serratia ureilytica TaxID=300181 RepID=UPI0018D98E91|nr:site-specific integrase [Serratia ureilytica]MBH2647846.1 site-specific integrase [Serratia ureilytica]
MDSSSIDLTFPMLEYGGAETPWDLRPLLFRGGAAAKIKSVARQIAQGEFGDLLTERIELVTRLHEHVAGDLAGGGSRFSAKNKIGALRSFFAWCDLAGDNLSLDTVADTFIRWTEHLLHRYRIEHSLSEGTLYDLSRLTATMLDRVLDRQASLSKSTRIRKPLGKGKVHTSKADKQDLQNTFAFGHVLADICNALTREVTIGALPVCIRLRTGQILKQWSGLPYPDKVAARRTRPQTMTQIEKSRVARAAWEEDRTVRTRSPLVNLRIESELLMFIAQTGMNLQQAHTLRVEQFHYASHLDGYQVRAYKNRREGEVLFEIFGGYREWFKRYLEWRSAWFPDEMESLLFPLIRCGGRVLEEATQFTNVMRICRELGMPMVRPRKLRGVRINWLLRESQNPDQVAELAQHTVETLIRVYAAPRPQIAMVEITRFHQQSDPSLSPPAPGRCVSVEPESMVAMPKNAPRPDCINAAGCLFCIQHRDIESEDHVWSLDSLRYLKSLELARYRPPVLSQNMAAEHPALLVIERLAAKLRFFEESSEVRRLWVEESKARIREGNYHPAWDGFIRLAELRQKSS